MFIVNSQTKECLTVVDFYIRVKRTKEVNKELTEIYNKIMSKAYYHGSTRNAEIYAENSKKDYLRDIGDKAYEYDLIVNGDEIKCFKGNKELAYKCFDDIVMALETRITVLKI